MTYQTTNDFDLTRQDGTYTGATGELVVSDGGTITLPTPTAGEKFGVRALRNDVTLLSNGSIEASTSDRRIDSEGNSVFVSDGTEWYLVSGNEYFGFDIPDSGIARYRYEQDLTDEWNNNDLTDNGGITFGSGGAQEGSYYAVFDGTDDYATTPFQFDDVDDFSFVGWIYFETFPSRPIVSQRDSFDTMDWSLGYDSEFTQYDLRVGESGADVFAPSATLNTGQWYHIGLTKGGDTWTIYTDASATGSNTTTQGWTTSDTVQIASRNLGSDLTNFRGDLHDFYSKELTQTEVQNHRDTGSIGG